MHSHGRAIMRNHVSASGLYVAQVRPFWIYQSIKKRSSFLTTTDEGARVSVDRQEDVPRIDPSPNCKSNTSVPSVNSVSSVVICIYSCQPTTRRLTQLGFIDFAVDFAAV